MRNILFYGNCQLYALKLILNLNNKEFSQINVECHTTKLNKSEFTEIILNADIIITQPINNNYRNCDFYSTFYLLNNCKKDATVILIDSCYLNFYFFDQVYKTIDGKILNKPCDYHYDSMLTFYKNKKSISEYISEVVNNKNYKTYQEINLILNNSIEELKNRYTKMLEYSLKYSQVKIISTFDFIEKNCKNILLFYSRNHPTNKLLQFISKEIIKILNIEDKINYVIDPLNKVKSIMYECVKKTLNFSTDDYKPVLNKEENINKICELYYGEYKKIHF